MIEYLESAVEGAN